MLVRRIDPASGVVQHLRDIDKRLRKTETGPSGVVVVNQQLITIDPTTQVSAVFGALPDGTSGFQPYIGDTTPPNQPSTPTVASPSGIISVAWDGLDYAGGQPPKDYNRTIVEMNTASATATSGWNKVDEMRGKGVIYVSSLTVSASAYFRLVSLDYNLNRSVPSTVVTGYVVPLSNDASIQNSLNSLNQQVTAAQATANGKNTAYYQGTVPSGGSYRVGDQWFNTSSNYQLSVWSGSTWQLAQDSATALTTAQGKNQTFTSATAPVANAVGDLWLDSSNGYRVNRWSGSAWVNVQDTAIATAQTAANNAQTTANGRNSTFIQGTTPAANATGDLWVDTSNGNRLNRWSGSAWVNVQDTAIATAQTAANNAQTTANGKNQTIVAATAPASATVGDLWLDSSNGYRQNRWNGSAWVNVQDTAISTAQTAANTAQTTANGKNTSYYQSTQPSGGTYKSGDLWFNTANNYQLSTYTGTVWQLTQDSYTALSSSQAASAYAGSKGKVWFQPSAPDGGTSYGWTGAADGSTSTLYSSNTLLRTNLATNPSFEASSSAVTVRTNLLTNPSLETAGVVYTMRNNLCGNPRLGTGSTGWASNWFGGGSNAGTTTRVADSALGGYGWQKTWTTVGTNSYDTGVTFNGTSVTPGHTYSFAANIHGNCAMPVTIDVAWMNSSGSEIANSRSYNGGSVIGGETVLVPNAAPITLTINGIVAPAGAATCVVLIGHEHNTSYTYSVNDSITVGQLIIEQAPQIGGAYFDGSTAAGNDFTYAWAATADASTSMQQVTSFSGGSGLVNDSTGATTLCAAFQSTQWSNSRSKSARVVALSTSTDVFAELTGMLSGYTFQPNTTYTLSAVRRVAAPLTGASGTLARANISGELSVTVIQAPPSTGSGRMVVQFTTGSGTQTTNFVRLYSGTPYGGGDVWFDDIVLEQGAISGPAATYFDGSSTAAGDFTYSWTSTADASTSIQWGASSANVTPGNTAAYQSAVWSNSRGHSLRLTPISQTSNDSFAAPGGDVGGMRLGMVAGQTYTASATVHIPAPLAGTIGTSNPALSIMLLYRDSGGTYHNGNAAAANVAGSTRVSVTVAIPAGATEAFVRLYHGGYQGAGDVWWDDFLLEQSSVLGTYFDGSLASDRTYDLWVNTSAGNMAYKWDANSHSWLAAQDAAIATAQSTANGKNTVYYAGTAPSGGTYKVNDVWFNTASGNQISYWSGSAWTVAQLGTAAIANLAITNAQIANGTIGTAQIGSLDAGKITTGTLSANVIGAATIAASALAAGAVTANAISAGAVGAQALAANSVTATAIAANTIVAGNGIVQSLDAGTITVGTLNAARIGAKSISVDKLLVGDRADFVVDPYFSDSQLLGSGTTTYGTTYLTSNSAVPTGAPAVPTVLSLPSGGYDYFAGDWFAIVPGDQYYVEGWAVNPSGSTTLGLGIWGADSRQYGGNNYTSAAVITLPAANARSWTKVSGYVTIPSLTNAGPSAVAPQWGRVWAGIGNGAGWWLTGFHIRRKNGGELIVDGSIVASKIAVGAVTAGALSAGAVSASAIAANTITAAQIASSTITATQLASGSVTASQIAAGAVTANAMSANSVAASAMVANTITAAQIAANTITAGQIAAGTVTAAQIAANTITGAQLAAGSVSATAIAANTITAGQIAANTITAGQIAAGTITATQLAAGSVTATQIAAGSIVAGNGIVSSLDAGTITVGTLNAARIGAQTISADKLVVGDPANRVVDPYMSGTGAINSATYVATSSVSVSAGAPYDHLAFLNARDSYEMYGSGAAVTRPATGGEQYYCEVWARATSSATQPLSVGLTIYNDGGGANWLTAATATVAQGQAGWVQLTGYVTVPSTISSRPVTKSVPWLQINGGSGADITNWYVTGWITRRKNSGELIVDGSITANSLAANAVTAGKINAGAIDGMTITGATIVGGQITTSGTSGAVVARMGPSTVTADGSSRPGIGFTTYGSSSNSGGLYTTNGLDVTLAQGWSASGGGSSGMAQLSAASNTVSAYAYSGITLQSRGTVTLNNNGPSGGVQLTGNTVWISGQGTPSGPTGGVQVSGVADFQSAGTTGRYYNANAKRFPMGILSRAYLSTQMTFGTTAAATIVSSNVALIGGTTIGVHLNLDSYSNVNNAYAAINITVNGTTIKSYTMMYAASGNGQSLYFEANYDVPSTGSYTIAVTGQVIVTLATITVPGGSLPNPSAMITVHDYGVIV